MKHVVESTAAISEYEFVSPARLCQLLDISRSTCKRRRLEGSWIEGIHWVKLNSRTVRYNLPMLKDLLANQGSLVTHQRAIETYLGSLLSSQKQKRKSQKAV
jgi:CHAD domain-containing protein